MLNRGDDVGNVCIHLLSFADQRRATAVSLTWIELASAERVERPRVSIVVLTAMGRFDAV